MGTNNKKPSQETLIREGDKVRRVRPDGSDGGYILNGGGSGHNSHSVKDFKGTLVGNKKSNVASAKSAQLATANKQTKASVRTEDLERGDFADKHNLSRFIDESDAETKYLDTIARSEGKYKKNGHLTDSYGQVIAGLRGYNSWTEFGEQYNRRLALNQLRRHVANFEKTGQEVTVNGNWNPKFIEYMGGKYAPIPTESVEELKKKYKGDELKHILAEKEKNPNWVPNMKRILGVR